MEGVKRRRVRRTDEDVKILMFLSENPGSTAREVYAGTGVARAADRLSRLYRDGTLKREIPRVGRREYEYRWEVGRPMHDAFVKDR